MLALKNIHTHYGSIRAVRGISITVNKGEMVCLNRVLTVLENPQRS